MNVILTGSQKNNIGKTIISIKLAIELANSGKNVLMMDLSSGKIKMSEYLNVNEDIIYDIVDVVNKTCTLEQGIIEINENLSLLPCPRIAGKINEIKKESFINLLQSVEVYDYVIIDADKLTSVFIDFSIINNAITINNNDFSCIKEINTDKTISSNAGNFIVAINKYNKKKAKKGIMMKSNDIEKLTETTISALIEENIKYSDLNHEKFLDDNFLKTEIKNIVKNLK
ncbi:MAG TPA: AAA family ATPase [Sedimentibacter sp.]|nr:AAA family ATPase [Sedimentibacter sp.]HOG62076.1 AAA family ATPase [Sedimentibacter sp.]HOT21055.1 AAA family ATPase [Sedimentibacter sp.]